MTTDSHQNAAGINVTEAAASPGAMIGVATAVPGFVGYTEKAELGGTPMFQRAIRVGSLDEFETIFGAAYAGDAGQTGTAIPTFLLHAGMQLFYANGGQDCYVVSVGSYVSTGPTAEALTGGLDVLAEVVGPSMLVVPDAVSLPANVSGSANPWESDAFTTVVRAMLAQSGERQDRFAILDVYGTQYATADNWQAIITWFRASVGADSLGFGAAYFPFIVSDSNSTLLPASAAMAGVYTAVDHSQGVWNPPANIALTGLAGLSFPLTDDQQALLNTPPDGRAVDALREFVGRGPVVWGARTLDGNSNDYRYIQIRRTLIYIEQSIKTALQSFEFAANDPTTWASVTSMISRFLQGLWSQGGLIGASADQAYAVQCGLGSTMTPQDILDGYMLVQVTLAMIHPAEFIELCFRQEMAGAQAAPGA
jgi:phage tail sheath protein FI